MRKPLRPGRSHVFNCVSMFSFFIFYTKINNLWAESLKPYFWLTFIICTADGIGESIPKKSKFSPCDCRLHSSPQSLSAFFKVAKRTKGFIERINKSSEVWGPEVHLCSAGDVGRWHCWLSMLIQSSTWAELQWKIRPAPLRQPIIYDTQPHRIALFNAKQMPRCKRTKAPGRIYCYANQLYDGPPRHKVLFTRLHPHPLFPQLTAQGFEEGIWVHLRSGVCAGICITVPFFF